jgi:hypothetical protein
MTFKVRGIVLTCVIMVWFAAVVGIVIAQTPGRGAAPAPARGSSQAPARGGAQAPGRQASGNLLQVMRGIIYPASNVIFAAQSTNPASVKPATPDPALSTDPLSSTYGGWQAVENAGIAMAEAANLLTIPGRVCANGRPVPVQNADWPKFVEGLRAAGMAAYKAAQSKNQDAILDAADKVSTACSDCHDVYREKTDAQGGLKARCTK